jgi:5-formyltetrahydrofolate cyclo-ligase
MSLFVPLFAVALAFDEQLVDALPMDQHDRHVDVLATPGGLLLCSERAKAHMHKH